MQFLINDLPNLCKPFLCIRSKPSDKIESSFLSCSEIVDFLGNNKIPANEKKSFTGDNSSLLLNFEPVSYNLKIKK